MSFALQSAIKASRFSGIQMNAAQLGQAAMSAVRESIAQPVKTVLLEGAAFSGVFAFFLIPTLVFCFLYGVPRG